MIGEEIRTEMAAIPGIDVQVQTASNGPSAGKPVNLRVQAHDPEVQQQVVDQIREKMADIGGFTDVTDSRPSAGGGMAHRGESLRGGAVWGRYLDLGPSGATAHAGHYRGGLPA